MSLQVDNLKKVVSFLVCLANEGGKDFADGKISVAEALSSAVALSGPVVSLMQVDFKELWPEMQDLSPEEWQEVADLIKSKLDLPEESVEEGVKSFLDVSKQVYVAVFALISAWKALKKPA